MPTPAAVTAQNSDPTVWHTMLFDVLPAVTVTFGLVAAIWLACAVITGCGAYLGTLVVTGARALLRACTRDRRHDHDDIEFAKLITVYPDGDTSTLFNLEHYRRRDSDDDHAVETGHGHDTDPSPGRGDRPDCRTRSANQVGVSAQAAAGRRTCSAHDPRSTAGDA